MIQIMIMIIFASITIYNLSKYSDILIRAKFTIADIISLIIVLILIFVAFKSIIEKNAINYSLAIVFFLYTISGIIVRGYNKGGVYDFGRLTHIAKFTKWNQVDSIKFEYFAKDAIDVIFVTKTKAIRHRYDEKYEDSIVKIKKELNI
ncbi:hypothetical protein [Helcococcus sueciensis]|uniref:hypothetical protein n=1 Tax=Helcococcus sueciensis TaxID=241555 RepID=UPI000420D737|nr:hypothetical protein [Helcococcus sueciensis]